MAAFYVGAGILHFVNPAFYDAIVPRFLPSPRAIVYVSGTCEILFGLLLLPATTRRTAAWLIIALLIAVFPANIQMTIDYAREHRPYLWLTIARLPLQFALIYWAWVFARRPGMMSP